MKTRYSMVYGLYLTFPKQTVHIGIVALENMDLLALSQYVQYLKNYYEEDLGNLSPEAMTYQGPTRA